MESYTPVTIVHVLTGRIGPYSVLGVRSPIWKAMLPLALLLPGLAVGVAVPCVDTVMNP